MKKAISILLKIIATVIGIFCIPYGIMGFIGINPAGTHDDWEIRLIGMIMTFMGFVYICPNKLIENKFINNKIYYSICLVPFAILFICAIVTIIKDSWDSFVFQDGLLTSVGVLITSSFAPLSYYFYVND